MKVSYLACAVSVAAVALASGLTAGCGNAPAATAAPGTGRAVAATVAGSAQATAHRVTVSQVPAVSPPGTHPPALTGPAILTVADNNATVRLRTGQRVTAMLVPGGMSWDVPAVSGAAVKRISARGGYPGRQPARAVFLAVSPGEAVIWATTDIACLHTVPACEPAQLEWRITVIVAGG